MKRVYQYVAFGQVIESTIRLPGLIGVEDKLPPDIKIGFGNVPMRLARPLDESYFHQSAVGEFLLRIAGVASYYVTNGTNIVIQLHGQNRLKYSRAYLFGTVMGVLLMQRGIVPLHGSSVAFGGKGVIFTGISGIGKSTIAAALHQNGCRFLADDISALSCDIDGRINVYPGYTQQKLKSSATKILGISEDKMYQDPDGDKFIISMQAGFCPKPVPIAAIYEIVRLDRQDVNIIQLGGAEKLAAILANTYRVEHIMGLGLNRQHFVKCSYLAKQVPVFRMCRPYNEANLCYLVNRIIDHASSYV